MHQCICSLSCKCLTAEWLDMYHDVIRLAKIDLDRKIDLAMLVNQKKTSWLLVCDVEGWLEQRKLQAGVSMCLGPSLNLHFDSHCVHVYTSYNSILNCMEHDGKLMSSWIARTHCCVECHMTTSVRCVSSCSSQTLAAFLVDGVCAKVCRQESGQPVSVECNMCVW